MSTTPVMMEISSQADRREKDETPQVDDDIGRNEETPLFLDGKVAKMEEMKVSVLHEEEEHEEREAAMDTEGGATKKSEKDHQSHPQSDPNAVAWRKQLDENHYVLVDEERVLMETYERNKSSNSASFLLISGPSGTGKTLLAQSLRQPVEEQGGYFLTGKFDQLRRPEPYAAFVAAFTQFTNMVIDRGEAAVLELREAINEAVGDEASVLTRMIPALEKILGHKKSCESEAKADNAIQRFVFVFRMFMRAVCSPQKPMILLLDDLQYADDCSLDVLARIVTDTNNEGLVLMGTCDDKVSPNSYFALKLREMEDKGHTQMTNIVLGNLEQKAVDSLLTGVFELDGETSQSLGKIVSRQTGGNLFYIVEFLSWLRDEDLLYVDTDSGSWNWDEEEINMTINTCRVGGFLVDKLEHFSPDVKEVLKVAACLGSYINEGLIQKILDYPVGSILDLASGKGILVHDQSRAGYAFGHDGLQHAAYNLIPPNERELFHLEVGRRLWRKLDSDELDQNIFVVLSQMRMGWRLISRDKEKLAVATLCLHAGTKAAKSSTFRTASVYLNLGIELLDKRSWRDQYELTLALHNAAAEMEMCTAKFENMDVLLEEVFSRARSFEDKLQAYQTKIYALGVSDRQQEAIDLGIEVLKSLGEHFPRRLCTAHLISEYKRVKRMLKGRSDEQLLRLPEIQNKEKLQAMQVLLLLVLNTLLVRPKFAPFVLLKLMKLTLQYGMSVLASTAFAAYGMLCITATGDVDEAFRFGELGLALLERYEVMEYLPRAYAAFYGCIWSWKKPLKGALEPLLRAHRIGMQTGDVEFASLCANLYCFHAIDSGIPLQVIHQEWSGFRDLMLSNRQHSLLRLSMPTVQAVHHYMGLSEDPLSTKGDIMDYDEALEDALKMGNITSILGIRACRMMVAYVFRDCDLAAELAEKVLEDLWQMPPTFEQITTFFFSGLVAVAMVARGKDTRRNRKTAKKILRYFRKWATSTPHNCLDKLFLLEAEIASVAGKNAKAYEKYTCSIALAKDSGFLFMHALANEHAGRHLYRLGDLHAAAPYFRRACLSYEEWGGKAKLEQLLSEVDMMYEPINDS